MARDRVVPFMKMIEHAVHVQSSVLGVVEAMRMFGYVNEIEYSELTTVYAQQTQTHMVRHDGAETIPLARSYNSPEEILPSKY